MAAHKKNLFADQEARLAGQAKALAHPARIQILKLLAKRNTCICGDIVNKLPLAQATVSQHLKVLKEAGLIQGDIEGPRVCYCLDRKALREAVRSFEGLWKTLMK